jgi:hypothetical protein
MGLRIRGTDLKFCRRVGERGPDPRPVIVGLNSEEERRMILSRTRQLRGGRYDNVAVVPDLTRMQRRGEDKLSSEAESKNRNLTADDREKGLRWMVVGRRGEKRLIKGTEREQQRDRAPNTLGGYLSMAGCGSANNGGGGNGQYGTGIGNNSGTTSNGSGDGGRDGNRSGGGGTWSTGGNGGNVGGGNGGGGLTGGRELGARQRDNFVPVQQQQQQYYSGNNQQRQQNNYQNRPQQQRYSPVNNRSSGGNYGGNGGGNYGGYGGQTAHNNSYNGSGYRQNSYYNNNGNGRNGDGRNGYSNNNGGDGRNGYSNNNYSNGYDTNGYGGGYSGNGGGAGISGGGNEYGNDNIMRPAVPQPMGNGGGAEAMTVLNTPLNAQPVESDRLETLQGEAACNATQQGEPRQRLGSKRGRDGAATNSDASPPRTRQRQ